MVTASQYAARLIAAFETAGVPDAAFDARCLLEDIGGVPHGVLPDERPLPDAVVAALDKAAEERLAGRPLQYILGEWDFLSLRLKVGDGVLIPRQDTELLCEAAADALRGKAAPRVLDLCAGSGCVGLGVASLVPGAAVTAVEKSPAAMVYLQENIARYPMFAVRAVQGDVFAHPTVAGPFDAILANPPYIPVAQLATLMREVQNEPRMALDGGEDGLIFYRAILSRWLKLLCKGGFCAVEIGFDQGEQVNRLFVDAGLENCCVLKDLAQNDRVVIGYK